MKSLYINNFKNIKELSIDSLGRVNLITGKNNTGKTSLLEAISIYASEGKISNILDMLARREEYHYENSEGRLEYNIKALTSLFYHRKNSFKKDDAIFIGETDSNRQIVLDLWKYRTSINLVQFVYSNLFHQ